MNGDNLNPRYGYPASNHYHQYPENHYNYYYWNDNMSNNNQSPEYSRNQSASTQIPPALPSPPPVANNSVWSKQTSPRSNFSGGSQITAQNPFQEHQTYGQTQSQTSFVRGKGPRTRSQTNSLSGNRGPRPTSQSNLFSENNSQNYIERPNAPMQTPRYVYPTQNDATWNNFLLGLRSKPGSSSSVHLQKNQKNNANHNNGNLNSNAGRAANAGGNNRCAGSPPLHFNLREIYNDKTMFKITNKNRFGFTAEFSTVEKYSGIITGRFCNFIDTSPPPTVEELVNTAKYIILVTQKYRAAAIKPLEKVINRRLGGVCGNWVENSIVKKMTLFYLLNLIVEAESVNFDANCGGLWNRVFENLISLHDNFGSLIAQASTDEKRQVYNLRCKWNSYISNGTLNESDRPFWNNLRVHELSNNRLNKSQRVNTGQTAVSYDKDTKGIEEDENDDADNLGHFSQAIDQFLKFDWLLEFPINEKDKQRFTEKYSVEKPSGKDSVYIYDRNVDFDMSNFQYGLVNLFPLAEKRQMIDVAKEVFYIEKVFGTNKSSLVTTLLIARMSQKESGLCLTERWIAVLLIHIILSAEATQSSSRKQPKSERPFCRAFSTEAFVANFQEFVRCLKSRKNKYKMYWMRNIWSSCLLEESLTAIDACNFWRNLEVGTSAMPATLTLKRPNILEIPDDDDEIAVVANIDKNEQREEVPTIVLHSSDDEDGNNYSDISDSEDLILLNGNKTNNSSVNIETNISKPIITLRKIGKKQWYDEFQNNRKKWWTAAFSMSTEDTVMLNEKYDFQEGSSLSVIAGSIKWIYAREKFCQTVLNMFPLRHPDQLLWVAKEAFFLAEDIGEPAIIEIVAFLVNSLREGFDIKPTEVKFISRLAAFFIIHIIIAVEEIDPSFLTYTNTQRFINCFIKEDVVKTAGSLSMAINDDGISEILQFLVLTWTPNGADDFTRHIRDLYNSKENLEASFLKNIYSFTVAKYNEIDTMSSSEIPVASDDDVCPVVYPSESDSAIGDKHKNNSIRCEPQIDRSSLKRKAVVVDKEKRDKIKEKLLAKTADNLQELFIPDAIKTVPSASNKTNKNSPEVSTESKSKRQHSSRTVSSSANTTSSELLGVNGKPLQQTGSRCEKAMENIRKMLRERNGELKSSKDSDDSLPSSSTFSGIQIEEKIIENIQSEDFVDNLLMGNLDFIFTENGIQVKTILPK